MCRLMLCGWFRKFWPRRLREFYHWWFGVKHAVYFLSTFTIVCISVSTVLKFISAKLSLFQFKRSGTFCHPCFCFKFSMDNKFKVLWLKFLLFRWDRIIGVFEFTWTTVVDYCVRISDFFNRCNVKLDQTCTNSAQTCTFWIFINYHKPSLWSNQKTIAPFFIETGFW